MAPTRQRKNGKSMESQSSVDTMDFPAPPQTLPTKSSTPTRTPTSRSPIKKAPRGLTANQKQALLDNLQLEITERARKLRAQYMLQAQGLRTRVEIRVNRIPTALRKAKMGDLLLKYNEAKGNSTNVVLPGLAARGGKIGSPSRNLLQENQRIARNSPSPMRQMKRHSDEMIDKENEDLSNPKKRVKAAPAPRVASTKQTDQVLSPRSANSRNAPQTRSPIRPPISMARPVSPTKTMPAGGAAGTLTKPSRATATAKVTATSKTGTSAVGRTKKHTTTAPPAPRARRGRPSNSSESSDASAKTTIVNRAAATKKEPAKRTVMGTLKSIGGAKKTAVAPTTSRAAPGGRVLRNRGAA